MSTKNTGGQDPLEKIFLLAGRRAPVDSQRADEIEEKTRDRWQDMLARRRIKHRRKQIKIVGGGFAIAASAILAAILIPRPAIEVPIVATVVNVRGSPDTGARGQAMTALRDGAELRAGTVLETSDGDGVALQLATGHSLRLSAASRVRIEPDSIVLDAGAVYLDSGGDGLVTPIEVRSRVANVRELGTQYMARLSPESLSVSVREGSVSVAAANFVSMASAGEMLQLAGSGQMQKSRIPVHGALWAWVTELAPVPALEGMNLADFLHWLAREQGWRLEFETLALARHAATVELHGSIDGLSGQDALAVVMGAAGWKYKLTEGLLTIDSREVADQ